MIGLEARLGRCSRCMLLTGIGLVFSVAAVMSLPEQADAALRLVTGGVAVAFGVLAVLHTGARLRRKPVRYSTARANGRGCGCSRTRR